MGYPIYKEKPDKSFDLSGCEFCVNFMLTLCQLLMIHEGDIFSLSPLILPKCIYYTVLFLIEGSYLCIVPGMMWLAP